MNGTYLSPSFLRRQESMGLKSTVLKARATPGSPIAFPPSLGVIPAYAGMTILYAPELK